MVLSICLIIFIDVVYEESCLLKTCFLLKNNFFWKVNYFSIFDNIKKNKLENTFECLVMS